MTGTYDPATFWNDKRPDPIPNEIESGRFSTIIEVFDQSVSRFADRPAYSNFGKTITFGELEQLSGQFAAYLQNELGLKPGDAVAIQMPNIIQFAIAAFGVLRAGFVIVNTNPLYTAREMTHQFNDSGAKAVICLANMAHLAQEVKPNTPIEHVIITELGDMLPFVKRHLMNNVVKHVKKMVPAYNIPGAVSFLDAIERGKSLTLSPVSPQAEDVAILQYTGGTTGVAKGAMLTHKNIVSNMQQMCATLGTTLEEGKETVIAPLPFYHIYSFTANIMGMMVMGNHNILITNPRDIPGFVKTLQGVQITCFMGLNTLFVALCNNEDFRKLDFSQLKFTISGGMALTKFAWEQWRDVTGNEICEGYGLTETSPLATINPPCGKNKVGTIGLPVSSTLLKVIDDEGNDILDLNTPGELCVKGPQVMKGYWQRPEATAECITKDGWFKTGDIAQIDEEGYAKIVDRKKDMIIVSGFNVYPNELEDVVVRHPGIIEAAAIGIPDDRSGEAVKIFVCLKDKTLTVDDIKAYCRENLTGYKNPKYIEIRSEELPKTNVGKILRRVLRDEELKNREAQNTVAA